MFLANKSCNRKLDSGNLTTHDNDLYCKICYGRLFGPKGYGFGVGAGVLKMDTDNNGNDPTKDNGSSSSSSSDNVSQVKPEINGQSNGTNGHGLPKSNRSSPIPTIKKVNITFDNFGNRIDICPRCNKQVYLAEKMMGGGKVRNINCLMTELIQLS